MRTKPSLSTKLLGLGVAFLLIALGSIGLLAYLLVRERSAVPQPAHGTH